MNTKTEAQEQQPVVIKKYANRRLYNTETSIYVTLDDLCQLIKEGRDFIVYDAKSGDDITRSVLTQIIVEQETKGHSLLPESFLKNIIRYYDSQMREVVPHYLEASLRAFMENQEKMQEMMKKSVGGTWPLPFAQMQELSKQNMALFEQAMSFFNPFVPTDAAGKGKKTK